MWINHLDKDIQEKAGVTLHAFGHIYQHDRKHYTRKWVYGMLLLLVVCMFLPWTQNIRSKGFVTTLRQEQRPQELNSQIPGKIIKWYVKEGDFVKAGDTLLQLAEVKDDYLDPNQLNRTQEQITANQDKAIFYNQKIGTAQSQIETLQEQRDLKIASLNNKLEQIERKIESKKADVSAAKLDFENSNAQIQRAKIMLDEGAISKIDFERRNAVFIKSKAALTDKENELSNLKQDLIVNKLEVSTATQEYADKIFKAQGDQFSSRSEIAASEEKVASLSNKYQNLKQRAGYYFVVAPQGGQIIKAKKEGLNEIIKEGEMLLEIVPENIAFAVEMFVEPLDVQLINIGQKVRFQFDGFPAIVFSGWPSSSYGTFGGKVVAIETNRNTDGKFRVLVAEDTADRKWPPLLKIGTGSNGFALLKNVPVYYELWRNVNGFPPEYYKLPAQPAKK